LRFLQGAGVGEVLVDCSFAYSASTFPMIEFAFGWRSGSPLR